MEIYLPIAEQSMNVFVLLGLGAAAGLLAGMFGVGGGFLATPLLIFVGIPPAVAVASQANQVVANSVSSLQVHWRRGNVDLRMGLVLLLGGMVGSSAGVWLFTYLKRIGLSKRLHVSPSTVTRMCAPLEKRHVVGREPDPRDARLAYVVLTKAGQQLITDARATLEGLSADVFRDRWTKPEIASLADLLGRLTAGQPSELA